MESTPDTTTGAPPRLINAVSAGFNAVATNVQLILIPLAFDLFLWFGPHLRIRTALQPVVDSWFGEMLSVGAPDMTLLIQETRSIFQTFLDNFNLASSIQTIPIGVPSLLSPSVLAPSELLLVKAGLNPFGPAMMQDLTSAQGVILAWFLFILLGLILGSLYFCLVARSTTDRQLRLNPRRLTWSTLQSLSLTFLLVLILLAISIPALLILSIVALISPGVAQIVMLIAGFFLLWSLIPLVFSPHGIFAYGMSAVTSLMTSMRLVRSFLPGTGLFVLVMLVLSQGLNFIWRLAPSDSWMLLIGITGHAFISTAILAASFIYYQGGMRWMQVSLQRMANRPSA